MKKNTLRTVTWIITIFFSLLFLFGWFKASLIVTPYGSPATSTPYMLGVLMAFAVIPLIMWTITYFVSKNETKKNNQQVQKPFVETKINKIETTMAKGSIVEPDTFEKLETLKLKILELVETDVLNTSEAEQKTKLIDKKIENIKIENQLKENYEKSKLNLDVLKNEGIITENEYILKLVKLKSNLKPKKDEDDWTYKEII